MTSTVVAERLEQLLEDAQNRILPLGRNESVKLYASLRDEYLSLEIRSPQRGYLPDFIQGTYGIDVEIDKNNEKLGPRVIFTSKEPELNIVFFSLADTLCNTVVKAESEKVAVASALERFEEFRELMQGEPRSLSEEETRGLIAEHLVLLYYIKKAETNVEKLIRSWEGPFGSNKDFVFGNQGFEVKSIRPNATSIKISSVDQLDPNGLELYLLTYCLDQVSNGYSDDEAFTLRQLVAEVKSILTSNKLVYSLYLLALAQTGYNEEEQGFADQRYRLQRAIAYLVTEGFPKLTASDVPAGLEKIKYSVKIPVIQQFAREISEVSIDLS